MSYFDTYMKRVNRYGSNPQERIQGKREHDFKVFMNKSPNLVRAWNNKVEGDSYKAVLQTKEYDQDEVTDYLLVPLDNEIPMGTIIYTSDSRHKNVEYEGKIQNFLIDGEVYSARRWINYAVDPYTSTGYNRYTIVELESEISWVDEGIKYTAFAHATGGGSGARDKNINLKFRMQFSEAGVYLPNKRYSIVMPTHPNIKKNMKITLGGETWRVAGFDSISVKGVSYVTLEETLTDKNQDLPIANANQLDNWVVTTDRGLNFSISRGTLEDIKILCYYNNELRNVALTALNNKNEEIENTDYTISSQKDNIVAIYTGNHDVEETSLKILLKETGKIFDIPFKIGSPHQEPYGPREVFVGETIDIKLSEKIDEKDVSFKNGLASRQSVIRNEDNTRTIITILGKKIGKDCLQIKNAAINYEFNFEVKSMWLGGDD